MSTRTTYEALKRRSVSGMVAVGVRQVFGQGINILGNIVLARMLTPSEFGVYTLLMFVGSFMMTLVGSGLGASLVRQSSDPTETDFRVVAALQFVLSIVFAGILVVFAPTLIEVYGIQQKGSLGLFATAGLAYVILSFQTVPQARLERELSFHVVAYVELAQIVAFNVALVIAAWRGFGGLSFAVGIMVRAIVGAIGFQLIRPSPFGLRGLSLERAREHLFYGIPFQMVNVISALKDSIVPLFIAAILGAREVGYINWASMLAVYPVLILMIVSRVYLPAFSRMQQMRTELGQFLGEVLQASYFLVAPAAVATLVFVEPITRLVFGAQWIPALPLFYLLWLANLVVPVTTALLAFLNAAGRVRSSVIFAVLCCVITWAVGVPAAKQLGAWGYAAANAIVQVATLYLIFEARKISRFSWVRKTLGIWSLAFAAGIVSLGINHLHMPANLFELALYLAGFGLVYLSLLWFVARAQLRNMVHFIGLEKMSRILSLFRRAQPTN